MYRSDLLKNMDFSLSLNAELGQILLNMSQGSDVVGLAV